MASPQALRFFARASIAIRPPPVTVARACPRLLFRPRAPASASIPGGSAGPARTLFGFGKPTVLSAAKAADAGKLKEALAAADADTEQADMFGYRPIHHAVASGGADIVALLVSSGADLSQKSGSNSVLHLVCDDTSEAGGTKALALVEGGAAVDHPGDKGVTPLHRALSKGNVHVGGVLLAAGADVDERNGHGCNALEWAEALAQRFDDFTMYNMVEQEKKRRMATDPRLAARQQELDAAAERVGYEPMDPRDKKPWDNNVFK